MPRFACQRHLRSLAGRRCLSATALRTLGLGRRVSGARDLPAPGALLECGKFERLMHHLPHRFSRSDGWLEVRDLHPLPHGLREERM